MKPLVAQSALPAVSDPLSAINDPLSAINDPLSALPPLILPVPVSWWPPAPLWWLLPILLIPLIYLLFRAARRYRAKQRLLHAFRSELAKSCENYRGHGDPARCLKELSMLLRRTALQLGCRDGTNKDCNEAWLVALDALAGDTILSKGPGRQLLLQYQPNPTLDIDALQHDLHAWSTRLRITTAQSIGLARAI